MKGKKRGVGFKFAFDGVKDAFKSERNFKIHISVAVIVIVISLILKLNPMEWVSIILVIGFVLVSEMFNTSIELLLDYLNPEIHPSVKIIKDLSAGAVLIAAIIAVIIGILIFLPKFITIFI